jgi:hypothetical protein
VQDVLTSSFKTDRTGNQILAEARGKALALGLKPSIYSHPIGHLVDRAQRQGPGP